MNLATTVYLLEGDKDKHQFVPIHEGTTKNVTYDMLDEKKVNAAQWLYSRTSPYGHTYIPMGREDVAYHNECLC